MDSQGCHPKLSNDDFDKFEASGWLLDEPIAVKLINKRPAEITGQITPSRPVLGNIVERKPKKMNSIEPTQTTLDASKQSRLENLNSLEEIDRENQELISQMTQAEIEGELQWIQSTLPPETLQFLANRRKQ